MATTVRTTQLMPRLISLTTTLGRYPMNVAKIVSVALLLLIIQGCKITQVVPEGGHIQSRTGLNDCASGQTCVINVPGTVFADTFTAVPAAGYKFSGWKHNLCVGKTTPCALEGIPTSLTSLNNDLRLEPIFEIELLGLLPQNTRGVLQLFPRATGVMSTNVESVTWGTGPLQILEKYSAGMDITGAARRLVLAQLADAQDQFLLVARLESLDVETLTAAVSLTAAGTYQGFPLQALDGTDLQLARLDSLTLAIGPRAALERALDSYTGAAATIESGPLGGDYTRGLKLGTPNSFIYGLPALYGPVAAPGNGAASLNQARVVSASFSVSGDVLSGSLAFFTNNADTFVAKLKQELTGYTTPPVNAYFGTIALVDLNGLSVNNDVRPLLKTLFLDMDAVDYAATVVHGGDAPWLNFQVGEDPGAIFVNYEFKGEAERTAFEIAHLPAGFKLAPIPIVAGETPRYFMVQNMYQSSGGLVQGARSEWSVFVEDPEDPTEPRFFVLDPQAATLSADPVNLITLGSPVTHELTATAIESYIGRIDPGTQMETETFYSSINWPQSPETRVDLDRGFMATNDYVFWGGAVADRILYNTTAQNPEVVLVDPNQFTVRNNSLWTGFVNAEPLHAVVYLNPQEIVISPWWNLDAAYLDITPTWRQTLINFKNNFYPGLVQGNARSAIRGQGLVPAPFTTADSMPTAYYHFSLLDPTGLLNAVAPPGTLTPTPVALFDDEPADYYLTLAVSKRENDPCGTRAEWITYVVGSGGRPESVRLDTLTTDSCLDPVSLLAVATELSQTVSGNMLTTQLSTPFIQFEATVDLSSTDDVLTGADWLEAGDRSCSLNGICDKLYYDGHLATIPAKRADTVATVVTTIETPWDDYIDTSSGRAGVRQNPSLQALNPWRNLRPFASSVAVP